MKSFLNQKLLPGVLHYFFKVCCATVTAALIPSIVYLLCSCIVEIAPISDYLSANIFSHIFVQCFPTVGSFINDLILLGEVTIGNASIEPIDILSEVMFGLLIIVFFKLHLFIHTAINKLANSLFSLGTILSRIIDFVSLLPHLLAFSIAPLVLRDCLETFLAASEYWSWAILCMVLLLVLLVLMCVLNPRNQNLLWKIADALLDTLAVFTIYGSSITGNLLMNSEYLLHGEENAAIIGFVFFMLTLVIILSIKFSRSIPIKSTL